MKLSDLSKVTHPEYKLQFAYKTCVLNYHAIYSFSSKIAHPKLWKGTISR